MAQTDLFEEIKRIFNSNWKTREGRVVPDTENLALDNDAVILDGTVLYADMADSTGLVDKYKPEFAAEMYKAYLVGACRILRDQGGEITAFDGDRVMAIFLGDNKNTSAVKAALMINYVVQETNKIFKQIYTNATYQLRQLVGVDTSKLFVAKTGIRKANDLVWVGRAANYAAKLCAIGEVGYPTYITENVYNKLADEVKYGGSTRQTMWEKLIWKEKGLSVYRSSWYWTI